MSNNSFYEEEPTEPVRPPQQEQQGRLILSGDGDAAKRPNRRPYQFPPQQQQPPFQRPGQQAGPYPIQPPQKGQMPQPPYQGQQGLRDQQWYPVAATPANNPNVRQPQYAPPAPMANSPAPRPRRGEPSRRRLGCIIAALIVLVPLCAAGVFAAITVPKVMAFGSAISTQAPLSSQTGYMNTSDRINILVMGYGGGTHDGAYLTDSMVVMSLIPSTHHTTLISVPRDLYVQIPPNSGQYQKINSAYEVGSNNNANPVAGGQMAAQKVASVTGMPINYWLTINFNGFRELINSIGGVDVYVPDSFNACYPKNDNASVDASWVKVQFNKGMQHMDGETAIRYARAREPLDVCGMGTSMNQSELTDFARSARQQIIMKAVLTKVKQASTWPMMFNAMTALQHTIFTNLSLADLSQFALKMDLEHAHRVGLSNQNVLVDAQAPDGGYILQPQNGNWQAVANYVKQQLYN